MSYESGALARFPPKTKHFQTVRNKPEGEHLPIVFSGKETQ